MLVQEPFQSEVAKRSWADWQHVHVGPRDKEGVIVARWGPYAWVAFDDVAYPVTYHFANLSPLGPATDREVQSK